MKKNKEQMIQFLNMLENVLEKKLKHLEENSHQFDDKSEECKGCECFAICKEFTSILKTIADSNYDKSVKSDLAAFVMFVKQEYLFNDNFDIDNILNDEDSLLSGYYQRFDSVINDFKNYDKLIKILDDNQLSLLRKIILDVTNNIENLMNKIMDKNRSQCNILISKLRKPQQEEKSYEDMTKEELIEELKSKHSY